MNSFEQYKIDRASEHAYEMYDKDDDSSDDIRQCDLWDNRNFNFIEGFDAAMALELPIHFHNWCVKADDDYKDLVKSFDGKIPEKHLAPELYKYWIDNVYKPE